MARSIRIEFPGAFYHVMGRGNRREAIFRDAGDRGFLTKTLGEACARTGWRVHAWVLMGNHYHLLIETPEANLVTGMQWLQNTYTRRFNTRHRLWGRVFGDRYKAVLVEGGSDYHYETLLDYIHLNPVRAGLVPAGESVRDYPWSSLASGYALPPGKRPAWLATESGFGVFGFPDTAAGRRRWVERLERRAAEEARKRCGLVPLPEEVDARCSHLRRGWYWGTQEFAKQILRLAQQAIERERDRGYRASLERQAHGETRAEELLQAGLTAANLTLVQARHLPGSEWRKVAVARVIWEKTTVSQRWLAEHLGMSSAANVSQQLRRNLQRPDRRTYPASFKKWLASVKK